MQRHSASYSAASTAPGISHLEVSGRKDVAYCGSQFQPAIGAPQPNRCERQRQNERKASISKRFATRSQPNQDFRHDIYIDPASHTSLSRQPAPRTSSPHRSSTCSDQRCMTDSLPFPKYSHTSTSSLSAFYQPPPVTRCYQLDRFLDEAPDFRTASLSVSGKQDCSRKGLSRGSERSRKHWGSLKIAIRGLEGMIEGL
jgi:hypothetical protein